MHGAQERGHLIGGGAIIGIAEPCDRKFGRQFNQVRIRFFSH